MTMLVCAPDVDRFRAVIGRRLGLHFDDTKMAFLEDVLRRNSAVDGHDGEAYLRSLETRGPFREERALLAQELTVTETYFFRNIDQFRAFAEIVLPECMRARSIIRQLRILSAGCASGEEPYSLAMLLRDRVTDLSWDVSVRAVDVNPAVLKKAQRGRYSPWSLRETPKEIQQRWFKADEREFVLHESIRGAVAFEEHNLAEENAELWQPQSYDVVFCRNVIMYLTPEATEGLVARIARALTPGGYLFLGHAETLRGLSQEFHLCHTHGTFYYQRRDAADRPSPKRASADVFPAFSVDSLVPVTDAAETWVDIIHRAAEHIRTLTETSAPSTAPSARPEAARPAWELGRAIELLEKERFADALDLVHAAPMQSARDPDVLLLRAVLLTHSGQLEQAADVCTELLQLDDLNAGAHYLLALCREGLGDRQGAIDHDQVAIYLDPGFAMPRFHLGLLARRAGDRSGARRELEQALVLLQREDTSRVLLFGGGFHRDALVALCRAELRACRGPQ